MEENSTKTQADGTLLFAGEAWFDPIETGIRDRVRGFIQELLEQELTAALGEAAEGSACAARGMAAEGARGTSGRRASRKVTGTGRGIVNSWAASVR